MLAACTLNIIVLFFGLNLCLVFCPRALNYKNKVNSIHINSTYCFTGYKQCICLSTNL